VERGAAGFSEGLRIAVTTAHAEAQLQAIATQASAANGREDRLRIMDGSAQMGTVSANKRAISWLFPVKIQMHVSLYYITSGVAMLIYAVVASALEGAQRMSLADRSKL